MEYSSLHGIETMTTMLKAALMILMEMDGGLTVATTAT